MAPRPIRTPTELRPPDLLERARVVRTPTLPVQEPPVARSIHWRPAGGGALPPSVEHPVFITQATLREIGHHVWSAAAGDVLGFLLGERMEEPGTGTRYVVITATTRSSYAVAEDGEEQIASDAWQAAQLEARRRRLMLLGWYRSAPHVGPAPTTRDVRSHRHFFAEPWCLGLITAPRAERPAGGVFRALAPGAEEGRFIPVYEVTDEEGYLAGGQKRTIMAWENYVTDDAPVRTIKAAPIRPRIAPFGPTIPVLVPKGHPEEIVRGKRRPKPSFGMSARRRRQRRIRIAITLGTLLLVAAGAAVALVP
jgi:proteasome lid subunit RPN8/RPN11